MPVAPVFIANVAALQAQLRLGALLTHDAGYAVLDQGMRFARVTMYDNLGLGTIATLTGYVSSENPTTETQILRTKAETLERDLVFLYLIKHLPIAFLDGGGAMPSWYNKEAPFRLQDQDQRRKLKEETEELINEALQDLTLKFNGTRGSCEVTTGNAPCAHTLGAMPDGYQAPLLHATLDGRYYGVNRDNLRGLPGLF